MKRQFETHMAIYEAIKTISIPWSLLKTEEESILNLYEAIRKTGGQEYVKDLREDALRYCCKNPEFWSYIKRMRDDSVPNIEIEEMMLGAEKSKLTDYAYEEVLQAINCESICSEYAYFYLKYYQQENLSNMQKERLMEGIRLWKNKSQLSLEELTQEERKFLWESVFAGALLSEVVADPQIAVMEYFKSTEILELFNYLSELNELGYVLKKSAFFQLVENASQIKEYLEELLESFSGESRKGFLFRWLDNDALVYDLKKLKNRKDDLTEEQWEEMSISRPAYLSSIYGDSLDGIDLSALSSAQEELLVYAISSHKKHFLSLIQENVNTFMRIPRRSFLLDPDIYKSYLNLNVMNKKNLECSIFMKRLDDEVKQFFTQKAYVFKELEELNNIQSVYVKLYHLLQYSRSDDRLRIFKEIKKHECVPADLTEQELTQLGLHLSEKPFSMWQQRDFVHISRLSEETAVKLLCHYNEIRHLIQDLKTGQQAVFLVKNWEKLQQFSNFAEVKEHVLETDRDWKELQKEFQMKQDFISDNRDRIQEFLCEGGAEICNTYLKRMPEKKEELWRLMYADLIGEFHKIKYYPDDLEKEIAFPITEQIESAWIAENCVERGEIRIWEEDRFLPVMQVGETPYETCLSYRTGMYKECLLSCFDSNKKVLYATVAGKLVFRAILRITKGSFLNPQITGQHMEFADLSKKDKQNKKCQKETGEEMVLFLERPYWKWCSEEIQKKIVAMAIKMLESKAEKLRARLVISSDYRNYEMDSKRYAKSQYYLYISASKNGKQYLDSLGGEANVSSAGSYKKNLFFVAAESLKKSA